MSNVRLNEHLPMTKSCCDEKPSEIQGAPEIMEMISGALKSVYSFDFGGRKGHWLVCDVCQQRWLYTTTCIGHMDWDHHLAKYNTQEAFFKAVLSSTPK